MTHEEWCDLLSTMEGKYNRKWDVAQIKILAASKLAPENYDSDTSTQVPRKKKARTGVLPAHKYKGNKNPKYKFYRSYFVLCKKAGMPERKYKSHSS